LKKNRQKCPRQFSHSKKELPAAEIKARLIDFATETFFDLTNIIIYNNFY
jgi:hypothetical protein